MKKLIFILGFLISLNSFCLTFPKVGRGQKNDFIPKNWEVSLEAIGDLNKDGKEDLVLFLIDSKKHKSETRIPPFFEAIPSALLVLLKIENGDYKLVGKVLSNVDNVDINYILRNLIEVEITENNVLQLHLEQSRYRDTNVYRWQNNRMELIGTESSWNNGGHFIYDSVNYSTGTSIVHQFIDGDEKKLNKIKSLGLPTHIQIKQKFKSKKRYALGEESFESEDFVYEPLDQKTENLIKKFNKAEELFSSLPEE